MASGPKVVVSRLVLLLVIVLTATAGVLEIQIHSLGSSSRIILAALVVVAALATGAIIFYTYRLDQSREMFRALASQHSENAKNLRESEARYRALVDSIDEGFCIIQMIFDESGRPIDYRFLEVNPSFEKQTGYRNARGKTVRELSPQHEQHWFDTYGKIALTGEPARFQNHADQSHHWYDVYAFRLGPPEERRVAVLFNDITRRNLSDLALRESEERFRAIYERAPIGIEQVAPDGRLMMVNSTQCAMLGYSESQLLSKTFEDITHPEDRVKEADLLKSLFSGEQDSYTLEKRYLHKSGAIVWVNITSTVVRNQSGSPEYRITVVEDVTARKHAEQALIRAEKLAATGRMASTMAHEINNPLGAALNSLYLATLDEGISEATTQYLDLAQRELLRVAQITKQTLGFYRETGLPTKVNLREVTSSVVELYRPKLRNKDIKVELRCRKDASIFGVEGEVQQIISNLLSNSIDAVSQQGCIRLRVEGPMTLDGGRPIMRLTIADNGGGIQPQHLSQIFEPFFSTKDSTGTGLGLWVTQQLVKKQHGKIRARSKVGTGTVF
jgi:PAS domain S-box-containing protein